MTREEVWVKLLVARFEHTQTYGYIPHNCAENIKWADIGLEAYDKRFNKYEGAYAEPADK